MAPVLAGDESLDLRPDGAQLTFHRHAVWKGPWDRDGGGEFTLPFRLGMRPKRMVRLFVFRGRESRAEALPGLSRRGGGHGGLRRYDAGLPGGDRAHEAAGSGEDCNAVTTGRRFAKSKPRLEGVIYLSPRGMYISSTVVILMQQLPATLTREMGGNDRKPDRQTDKQEAYGRMHLACGWYLEWSSARAERGRSKLGWPCSLGSTRSAVLQ